MAVELTGLLIVNAGYLIVGLAALALPGWLSSDRRTWYRAAAAFPMGLAVVAIPASYLALLEVPVGLVAGLVGLGVVVAAAARRRPWRATLPRPARPGLPRAGTVATAGIALVLALVLVQATRVLLVRPLLDWDAWAVWTAKARLLYADPSAAPAALRSGNYGQTPYPLGLPTVEALGFGAMGRYDGTLIGMQFALLAIAFPPALWSMLRTRARSWVTLLFALGILACPQMLYQLLTHYADVPLGLFVGLGVAAGGAWLAAPGERWLLLAFVLFLGMAGITKSEGFLFAVVGVVALLAAAAPGRRLLRPALLGAAGVLAIVMPWRIYCSAYGLTTPDYDLGNLTNVGYLGDHTDRLGPVVRELWRQLDASNKWGFLTFVVLLGLAAGLATRLWRPFAFSLMWLALSSAGLLMLYWVSTLPLSSNITNTSYRTIVSLLVGGASVGPLFVFPKAE